MVQNNICERRALRIGIVAVVVVGAMGFAVALGFADAVYVPALSQARYASNSMVTKELPAEVSEGLDVEMSLIEGHKDSDKYQTREIAMMAVHSKEAYAGKEYNSWLPFSLGVIFYADKQETETWNNLVHGMIEDENFRRGSFNLGVQSVLIPKGVTVLDVLLFILSIVFIEEIIISLICKKGK